MKYKEASNLITEEISTLFKVGKQVSAGRNKRYNYHVVDTEYTGTLFGNMENKLVVRPEFMTNVKLTEAVNRFTTSGMNVLWFYIPRGLLTIGLIIGFCYLDNY